MKVCYFGTYRPTYPRNRIVIDGLQAAGVQIVECNAQLWGGTDERIALASGGWRNIRFWKQLLRSYISLIKQERLLDGYDVMLVGYPGILDMYLARLLTWRRKKPLVFDVLMSIHLILEERALTSRFPLLARAVYEVEKYACKMADWLILDTKPQRDYFYHKYALSPEKVYLAPLGADNRVYYPSPVDEPPSGDCEVIYYGQFVPLHGVAYIVEAARLLRDHHNIHFTLVGAGTTQKEAESLVDSYALSNITFTGWVDKSRLMQYVSKADICLGVFGDSPQARYTVPNKIWEGLAMRKAVVTGETAAATDVFQHTQHLYFCPLADSQALAKAILRLAEDTTLRETIAQQGHDYYLENFTFEETGKRLAVHLVNIVAEHQQSAR